MSGTKTERTDSAQRRSEAPALHAFLYLVLESARPLAGGARFTLSGVDEIVFGRADARSFTRTTVDARTVLRVGVPDARMSRDHARMTLSAEGVTVEDLGSTNGTHVDGRAITRASVSSDTLVEVGQTLFLYSETVQPAQLRAPDVDCETLAPTLSGLLTLDPVHAAKIDRLKRVAASGVSVMLLGETGTGKEVLARAVHALSQRPGPFVAINCGAIPATLVESQLFGHVKGAFSGATRDEVGLVRSANYGTLFLDEIGDLPASSQAALLRVLQEGEVMPVGATRAASVDLRVVCATHQPLDSLMDRGDFRRDLYGRLAGFAYQLAPLRDRRVDLGLLVAALLSSPRVRGGADLRFRADAARALARYDWPLNVRELEQCLVTSSVLAEEGVIRVEDLPAVVAEAAAVFPSSGSLPTNADRDEALKRELLVRLVEARGNVSEVARAMGKARQQVQRWLRRFGVDADAFKSRDS